MASSPPLLVVLAGPNGAGKSTAAPRLLRGALAVEEFVNADTIAAGLSAFRADDVAFAAGRLMLRRIRALATARADFAFETTLATRSYAPWLREQRQAGYLVHIAFLALHAPELAVARVAERVASGGHDVPEDVVRRRFVRGLRNLLTIYDGAVDTWEVLDNSEVAAPRLIARHAGAQEIEVLDSAAWDRLAGWAR